MQICRKCGVSVSGSKSCCPLCQGKLIGVAEQDAYPDIPLPKYSRHFLFRTMTFAAITISVIVYALNMLIDPSFMWSRIVMLGVLCGWIAGTVAVWYRKRIIKNIMWELILIVPMCIAWDLNTSDRLSWSVDFVFPCMVAAAVLSTFLISFIMKYPPQEFIIYIFLESVCGLIPFVLVLNDIVTIKLPSVLCSTLCAVFIAAMLLFMGRSTGSEVKRKFHL